MEESGNESTTSGAGEYRTYTPPPLLDDVTEPTDHTPIPDGMYIALIITDALQCFFQKNLQGGEGGKSAWDNSI